VRPCRESVTGKFTPINPACPQRRSFDRSGKNTIYESQGNFYDSKAGEQARINKVVNKVFQIRGTTFEKNISPATMKLLASDAQGRKEKLRFAVDLVEDHQLSALRSQEEIRISEPPLVERALEIQVEGTLGAAGDDPPGKGSLPDLARSEQDDGGKLTKAPLDRLLGIPHNITV
jgi:hypothetical protein